MATLIKKCRVCGKEYESCRTAKTPAGGFRWQDVACSPSCGSEYLARVMASRAIHQDLSETNDNTKDFGICDEELEEYFE